MATVTKDFKVKSGLIVEGANATVNNYDILTKKQDDQDYIVNLIGGTATSSNTPDTVVKRDSSGDFAAGTITADLVGDVTGNVVGNVTAQSVTLNDGASNSSVYAGGSDLTVYGHNNLYLNTNNADIILQPDGYAKIYNDIIATQPYAELVAGNAQSAAEATAALDATSKANAAQAAAELTASNALSSAVTTLQGDISGAEANANTYTDNAITALNLSGTYDALGAAATAESNANSYTDTAVANLVDQAPAMLDTLNELAAAIADNPNYATDVANLVATKADTSYVDSEISGVDSAAQGYASTAQTNAQTFATSAANTAENNAKSYADSLAVNYDASGSAQLAQSNAETYAAGLVSQEVIDRDSAITTAVNAINTDVIEEGSVNLYFTNQRAIDAVGGTIGDAINLLTTSDIEEGSNLYFTDARAVSALEAVVPNFTEIDLNDIVTKVATQVSVPTASQITAHEFDSAVYRSAEYTVKVAYGSHTELSKVMLTLDSSDNIAITEYAVVGTNGSASTITADINAGNVRLRVTPANNNSVVTAFGTIIK